MIRREIVYNESTCNECGGEVEIVALGATLHVVILVDLDDPQMSTTPVPDRTRHPFLSPRDRLWVLAAHADDEVLGCGGLLAQAKSVGASIHVLYATCSGYRAGRVGRDSTTAERESELLQLQQAVGTTGHDVFRRGSDVHLRLDTVPSADLIDWLERSSPCALQQVNPTVLLIPSARDAHQDHRALGLAARSALRTTNMPARDRVVVLNYEVPGGGIVEPPVFTPNFYVELSEAQLEQKITFFRCYASQLASPPSGRNLEAIGALAAFRGLEVGVPRAEAYELVRELHRL